MKDNRLEKEFDGYFQGVNTPDNITDGAKKYVKPKNKVLPKFVKFASVAASFVLVLAVAVTVTLNAGFKAPSDENPSQGDISAVTPPSETDVPPSVTDPVPSETEKPSVPGGSEGEGNPGGSAAEDDDNDSAEPEARAGRFHALKVAYENGWLNEDDLKSIACSYHDFHKEENPYSGMYEQPAEELSKDVENELKQTYLNQIAKYPDGLLENVYINYYYGTYNGNIAVRIYSDYICIDPKNYEEYYIGNVVFNGWWDAQTWVYHPTSDNKNDSGTISKKPPVYEDEKQVSKIETIRNEGFGPFYRYFVRTFDFETGNVTDTWVSDSDMIPEEDIGRYNNPQLVVQFTEEQAQEFVKEIKSLGFYSWEEDYATTDIILDGGSEYVTVYFSDGTEKSTSIYFEYPPNYDKILKAFENYLGAELYLQW